MSIYLLIYFSIQLIFLIFHAIILAFTQIGHKTGPF